MPGGSCLDPCTGRALGGVPPSLLLVQLQGHLRQEASAPRPTCQSLGEHASPLPPASAKPHASASRLPDGCPGHAAQAPLSAPLQTPRRPARQQRSWVCPARQLTSPGTSGSAVVTVSGRAPTHLSTMSRNRTKHALGTLGPRPHLGLRVWGATRGCAGHTAAHAWPTGTHRQDESTDMGTHTLTYGFAHTHECMHTCTCSHHTHAPTPLPGLCRAARSLPLARISRWGLRMFCVQQPAGGELLGGGRCGGAQTAPSGSPSLHIVPGSRNVCW